jgi:hypothetical protein
LGETVAVSAEESRRRYEQLLLRVAAETVGSDGEVFPEPRDDRKGETRVRFTSRLAPERTAGLVLTPAWLQAFFFLEPNVSIVRLDDYSLDDGSDEAYTTERVRDLMLVIHAWLRGEGSIESRRTLLGRRRPQLRIKAGGGEWLAR